MRKRILTAVGIVIGVVALVTVACSQQPDVKAPTDGPGSNVTAPVSIGETTGPPVSTQPPVMVSRIDTGGWEETGGPVVSPMDTGAVTLEPGPSVGASTSVCWLQATATSATTPMTMPTAVTRRHIKLLHYSWTISSIA